MIGAPHNDPDAAWCLAFVGPDTSSFTHAGIHSTYLIAQDLRLTKLVVACCDQADSYADNRKALLRHLALHPHASDTAVPRTYRWLWPLLGPMDRMTINQLNTGLDPWEQEHWTEEAGFLGSSE